MAVRKLQPVLSDMLDAIAGIEAAVSGKSFAQFQQDWLLRHGVQRGLEIISEASRHLPDDVLVHAPDIPWKQVRGIGNLLRHEYHAIADELVWETVAKDLAPLRRALLAIAATVPDR